MKTGTGRQRILITLSVLIVIFVAPYLIATYFYQHHAQGISTVNRGQLIQPPLAFTTLPLVSPEGKPWPATQMRGHWTLLYFTPVACGTLCDKNLYHMRQVRLALGKNQDRVQRVLLTYPTLLKSLPTQKLQTAYAGTTVVIVEPTILTTFLSHTLRQTTALKEGGMFVVDPLGNGMLFYPPEMHAQAILKDLTRLLRVSQIG